MANFKLNKTHGMCKICGREGKDHCSVTYPQRPSKNNINSRRLRICKDCGALIYKVAVTKEDHQRNRFMEKKSQTIARGKKDARAKKKRQKESK